MIRFQITNPESEPFQTEWADEVLGDLSKQTAAQKVAELRRDYPKAAISVERSSIIPRKKQQVVRFKIKEKEDYTYYSAVFPIEQKDIKLAEIQERHPKAEIIPEEYEI
jgi:hypothetical protein